MDDDVLARCAHLSTAHLADACLRAHLPVMTGPAGLRPLRLDPRPPDALGIAMVGSHAVRYGDLLVADDDGVMVIRRGDVDTVLPLAEAVRDTERRQAEQIHVGRRLATQLALADHLTERRRRPAYSFREHLRVVGGAVEE